MPDFNEIKDFIERLKSPEFQKQVHEYREEMREIINRNNRNFFKTEKGKECSRKGWLKRNQSMKKACEGLDWHEKRLINRFYRNCPQGYEVDHIIPISKGGMHRLSNLQYLTRAENQAKFNKIN